MIAIKHVVLITRRVHGESQSVFGKRLGVSRSLISRWERAAAFPSTAQMEKLFEIAPEEALSTAHELSRTQRPDGKYDVVIRRSVQ